MATIVETTALALRRGTTLENEAFTGILGEITFDTGNPTGDGLEGVDISTTLRLHNGVTSGGIPLARADLCNVTTEALAVNRELYGDSNLAYADLRNLEAVTDVDTKQKINTTLNSYGLVNTTQLNTTLLNYAKKDMSNVITSTLAEGRGTGTNGNLAYANTTNINTKDLASTSIHNGTDGNKPLAFADVSNVNTNGLTTVGGHNGGPALANVSLSNVANSVFDNILFGSSYNFLVETTKNKDNTLTSSPSASHYPSSLAVTSYVSSYVAQEIEAANHMLNNLNNATSYKTLYTNDYSGYEYSNDVMTVVKDSGKYFSKNTLYPTKTPLTDEGDNKRILITIKDLDSNLKPVAISFNAKYTLAAIPTNFSVIIGSAKLNVVTTAKKINSNPDIYENSIVSFTPAKESDKFEAGTFDTGISIAIPLQVYVEDTTSTDEGINEFSFYPSNIKSYLTGDAVVINTLPTGTVYTATIKLQISGQVSASVLNSVGFLKSDLTNLFGMTDEDSLAERQVAWKIRHDQPIPSLELDSIVNANHYRIATVGMTWAAIKPLDTTLKAHASTLALHTTQIADRYTKAECDNKFETIANVAAKEETLNARITDVEDTLNTKITNVEDTLTVKIANEETARANADAAINAKIGDGFSATNTIAKAISDEATLRGNSDAAINEKIGDGFDSTNTVAKAISGEITRATTKEAELAASIASMGSVVEGKADKATTLAGYGITDAYTKTDVDNIVDTKADKATTLDGYGITNAYTKTEVDTAVNAKADKATTLSGYGITDAYTKSEVDTKLTAVYRYKGSVPTYDDLPKSGQVVGDVYNVEDTGSNYAWDGTDWDKLGDVVDLTPYLKKDEAANTYATKNAIVDMLTKTEASGTYATKDSITGLLSKTEAANTYVDKTSAQDITGVKTFINGLITSEITTANADVAERYKTDKTYPVGTLVQFGGEKEVTIASTEVNAVISQAPGVILNNECEGQPLAFLGKTKIRVIGAINKFDKIVLSDVEGVGCKKAEKGKKQVIAIALEDNADENEKLVRCVTKLTF